MIPSLLKIKDSYFLKPHRAAGVPGVDPIYNYEMGEWMLCAFGVRK